VLLLGAVILAKFVLHGPVNGRSLYLSVTHAARGDSHFNDDPIRRCQPTRVAREWLCAVDELEGSSEGVYLVRVHGDDSCWEGLTTIPGGGLPRRIHGCVHLREELF
jgi:hypothetical protein